MNKSKEQVRDAPSLKEIWIALFDDTSIQSKEIDDDCQGLMMLLETALRKGKSLSNSNFKLKVSNERILKELDWKTQEYNKLKIENQRLENAPCQKCSSLEAEMRNLRKKATEAQSRMKSIANILRLGENIEDSQSPRKNSALTLVSQMLLGDSPRRKKRCLPKTTNTWKETIYNEDYEMRNCTTLVPESIQGKENLKTALDKAIDKEEIITSPGDSLVHKPKDNIPKSSLTISLPNLNKESPNRVRKNLCTSFDKDVMPPKDSVKIIPETEQNSLELNGSLAEYVKEANSELDKIWFTASSSKSVDKGFKGNEEKTTYSKGETIINVTPERTEQKNIMVWKMKEVRGPSEHAGNKKFRQMTLSLSQKQKSKEVDLTTLSGFEGASVSTMLPKKSETPNEIRTQFQSRDQFDSPLRRSEELDSEIDTNTFQPKAASTQKVDYCSTASNGKNEVSPNYNYKIDTVRKKSERAKLEGWDCTKCAEYYAACGETSPSKVKGRINKCSRHRDKFKPTSNTPPGFWNPIFPDTEECKEQKMYTSIHCKRTDSM